MSEEILRSEIGIISQSNVTACIFMATDINYLKEMRKNACAKQQHSIEIERQ